MKPQLTSGIEGYHVCEQDDLGNLLALWASMRTAINTTTHATLYYVIPRLLQYVDGSCNIVKQLTVDIRQLVSSKPALYN